MLKFYLISKIQKSVADLEKLHKERSGANLTIASSHVGHEKVLIHTCNRMFKKFIVTLYFVVAVA